MKELTLTTVSQFLTKEVIDQAFKFKTQSEDNVKSVEVTRAAAAGEGMISAVYRIKVTGNQHTTSFVAKGLVQDILLQKTLNCAGFFKREVLFFSEVLPVLKKIQKDLGAKEQIQDYLPVCFGYHVDGSNDYILMEDLSEKKFTSLSENPSPCERDAILRVLAQFHSVSLALRLKKPEVYKKIVDALPEIYFNDSNRDSYAKYLQNAITIDKKVLAEALDKDSIYYRRFEETIQEDVYGQLIRLSSTKGDHSAVNHGDAWRPNFLYRHGKAVAIDFQILRCASPATDLSYFLLCSNVCRKKDEFNEAVDVYYKSLKYYLKDMGFEPNKVFSFDTLKNELNKYGKFGILASLTTIPLLASERCDVLQSFEVKYSGCERIPLEEIWRLSPITSEEHKLRLVNAVRIAVDVGLI